ncbi:MAG: hypothetical protein HKN92_06695 [Chitinophagales bacterium]|nr:hypothetical protein [Chitinophagales bacterium]
MKNIIPRILMLMSGLLLVSLFFFPMWNITLYAPQYPGGVAMYIWINKISGDTPATLQNINILNHYVGMKYIVPESIPELKYFPYIIYGMIALAVLFSIINIRPLYLFWGLLMIALAVAGLYDFYLWEYDYGHNLDPKAPIKIPEASFQPPLIGKKHIVNFIATSYPALSGYLAGLSIPVAFAAWWFKGKK